MDWTTFGQIMICVVVSLVIYLVVSAVEMAKKKDKDDG